MKKLIALMMALVMVLSLAACASKEEAPVEDTPAVEDVPAVEDEPVVEEDPTMDQPAAMPEEDPTMDQPAAMPEVDGPAAMPEVDGPAAMPEVPSEPEEAPAIEYMPEEKLNELSGLMDQLVGGINDELMVGTMEITADMYEYYGIPAGAEVYAVVSMPMIGSIAHEVVLVELPEGTDASAFAAEMEGLMNPMKWVCVQPESTWVKTSGNYVVAVMSTADMAAAVEDNFVTMFGA